MRVHVLALDGVFDLGLSAVLDAFQTANEVSEMCELAIPRFQVNVVGVRKRVRTAQGLNVPVRAADAPPADCVVVPAIGFKMPERLLVRSVSPQLASLTAKYLIVDSRPSQSAYALTDHLQHSDSLVQRFEIWARARLRHGFSLDAAAKAVGTSKRTLARRMQSVLGQSPGGYFQNLRIERAVHLLKTGSASVDEVALRVGYTEGTTLRNVLRRRLKVGIKEIRRRAVAG
jgi:transcriptional regulator GlxA family with amidase domain